MERIPEYSDQIKTTPGTFEDVSGVSLLMRKW